jgi:hypothetical protein
MNSATSKDNSCSQVGRHSNVSIEWDDCLHIMINSSKFVYTA